MDPGIDGLSTAELPTGSTGEADAATARVGTVTKVKRSGISPRLLAYVESFVHAIGAEPQDTAIVAGTRGWADHRWPAIPRGHLSGSR